MPGTIKRPEIRDGVRYALGVFGVAGKLDKKMDGKTSKLDIPDDLQLDLVGPNALVQIDNEVMRSIDKPNSGKVTRVLRGDQGSTPEAHVEGAIFRIYPSWGWTDRSLNRFINNAIRWLKPAAWVVAESAEFTLTDGKLRTNFPTASGISEPDGHRIIDLRFKDTTDSDLFKRTRGFKVLGTEITFRDAVLGQNTTLKATFAKFQEVLTDDDTAIDNDDWLEAIEWRAAHFALNGLGPARVKFAEYSAALNDRVSTPDEIIRMTFQMMNNATLARDHFNRPVPQGFINTFAEPE